MIDKDLGQHIELETDTTTQPAEVVAKTKPAEAPSLSAVERFRELAAEPRFQGWPVVGEPRLGERIHFFGQVLDYELETGNGVESYASILRHFGWVVVFGVTKDQQVLTLCQWKPGVNQASWELPPGGIGKIDPDAALELITKRTQADYERETGHGGGQWRYLGHTMIETGKFRGAGPDDHGLPAHMFLVTDLELTGQPRQPKPNEIMDPVTVPLGEFRQVLESGEFKETSAVVAAYKALVELGILQWSDEQSLAQAERAELEQLRAKIAQLEPLDALQRYRIFFKETLAGWYRTDPARALVEQRPMMSDPRKPLGMSYAQLRDDVDPADFGAYTVNLDTQMLTESELTNPGLETILPDSAWLGKPLHEWVQHVVDTHGKEHRIPGIEALERTVRSFYPELEDGKTYFFPGSLIRDAEGRWCVPCACKYDGRWHRYQIRLDYVLSPGHGLVLMEK